MGRYVLNNKEKIILVSDCHIEGGLHLPKQFEHLSADEIMDTLKVVHGGHITTKINHGAQRVAFVSVWGIHCGISTYSKFLVDELRPLCKELMVFAEHAENAEDESGVIRCWKRGESLIPLAEKLIAFEPDIVIVQHEFGIFPDARKWLSFMFMIQNLNTHVVFHSVYNHKDKTICEAAAPNIIVHSELAKEVLLGKGIHKNIQVIPHGCFTSDKLPRLWNIYKSDHNFMQFGFGFDYKGWETALMVCAELKKTYDDVFFTGIFSETKLARLEHEDLFQRLMQMVRDLGIQENVSFVRGFQSEQVLDSYFRLNKCAIFPYRDNGEHTVYGVTGAARFAMKSNIAVVTSDVPLFYDLKGVVPQCNTVDGFVRAVDAIWADPASYVKKQDEFLEAHSWSHTAKEYLAKTREDR